MLVQSVLRPPLGLLNAFKISQHFPVEGSAQSLGNSPPGIYLDRCNLQQTQDGGGSNAASQQHVLDGIQQFVQCHNTLTFAPISLAICHKSNTGAS